MAIMFPAVLLTINLFERGRGVVRRRTAINTGQMQVRFAGGVPELPDPDSDGPWMMGTWVFMMGPRASVCAQGRIEEVLQTSTSVVAPTEGHHPTAGRRPVARGFATPSSAFPGAEQPVLREHQLPGSMPARRSRSSASTGSGQDRPCST